MNSFKTFGWLSEGAEIFQLVSLKWATGSDTSVSERRMAPHHLLPNPYKIEILTVIFLIEILTFIFVIFLNSSFKEIQKTLFQFPNLREKKKKMWQIESAGFPKNLNNDHKFSLIGSKVKTSAILCTDLSKEKNS